MNGTVLVTRTYLRMLGANALRPSRAAPDATTRQVMHCSPEQYRDLYRAVGNRWHWRDRNAWSDGRLAEYLADPGVSIYVFEISGETAGYFELRRHAGGDVELVYFGLVPERIGQGFGGAMLTTATEKAWRLGATTVWLHTCTLDHPAAIANYRARGFEPYLTESYEESIE